MSRLSARRLHCELLEDRCLMAGDVAAYVDGAGNLHVDEAFGHAGGTQAVQLWTLESGLIQVRGLQNQSGGTTQVNGAWGAAFNVTGDILINLGGGNDVVRLADTSTFNGVTITTGPDAKYKSDDDYVFIGKVRTLGGVNINTGLGNDTVLIQDAQIGDGYFDNLIVKMGAGADNFTMQGVTQSVSVKGNFNLYMFDNAAEGDIDNVDLSNVSLWSSHVVSTGGGNDDVDYRNVIIGGDMLMNTGAGHDTAVLNNVQAIDDFFGYLGEGDDHLDMTDVAADQMELNGEGGIDTLNLYNPGYVRQFSYTLIERGNAFPIL